MKCDKSKSMLTTTKIMSNCQQGNLPNSSSAVEEPADWVFSSFGAEVAKLPVVEGTWVTSSLGAEVADIPELEGTSGSSEKINQKKV